MRAGLDGTEARLHHVAQQPPALPVAAHMDRAFGSANKAQRPILHHVLANIQQLATTTVARDMRVERPLAMPLRGVDGALHRRAPPLSIQLQRPAQRFANRRHELAERLIANHQQERWHRRAPEQPRHRDPGAAQHRDLFPACQQPKTGESTDEDPVRHQFVDAPRRAVEHVQQGMAGLVAGRDVAQLVGDGEQRHQHHQTRQDAPNRAQHGTGNVAIHRAGEHAANQPLPVAVRRRSPAP